MKLKLFKFSILFLSLLQSVHAIPNFSRQIGESCQKCHFQHYPALNSFGRSFKSSGFVEVGEQEVIEKDGLSLPFVINSSIVLKASYQKTNGNDTTGTDVGIFQFPYETFLFFSGRVNKFTGFILEINLTTLSITSFKMPFVYKLNEVLDINLIPFFTNRLGASYGFELLNTGSVRNQIVLEHIEDISAQQYIGTATPAQGITFAISHELVFLNVTEWIPFSIFGVNIKSPSHYLRTAFMPRIGNLGFGFGFQLWRGDASFSAGGPFLTLRTRAFALDGQFQSYIKNFPIGLYLSYASADKSIPNEIPNLFNPDTSENKTALAVLSEFGIVPNILSFSIGYRTSKNQDNAFIFGLIYQFVPNLKVELVFSKYSGSFYANNPRNQLITFLLYGGF